MAMIITNATTIRYLKPWLRPPFQRPLSRPVASVEYLRHTKRELPVWPGLTTAGSPFPRVCTADSIHGNDRSFHKDKSFSRSACLRLVCVF